MKMAKFEIKFIFHQVAFTVKQACRTTIWTGQGEKYEWNRKGEDSMAEMAHFPNKLMNGDQFRKENAALPLVDL